MPLVRRVKRLMRGAIAMQALREFRKLIVLTSLFMVSVLLWAQDDRIIVQAVDGRNGKPIAKTHLLIFSGESPEDVRLERNSLDLVTDVSGFATLTFTQKPKWIQVFVDDRVLCQTEPNGKSFSIGEIMSTGLKTPNTCGSLEKEATSGHFVVFARPAHFLEKMRR
jgi:hypothetical protein